jgi:protein FRG1
LLTAIPIDEKYVAFKSAYGKYLSINQNGLLIGRSDAIGNKGLFFT